MSCWNDYEHREAEYNASMNAIGKDEAREMEAQQKATEVRKASP